MSCFFLATQAVKAAPQPTLIKLDSGLLLGEADAGVSRFLAIPYAKSPTGERRWRAPQAPSHWTGVRNAREYAAACAQMGNLLASDDSTHFEQAVGSEDCLYLNLWRPSDNAATPREVLVFIHGGAGTMGSAAQDMYDGARLARELDAIVVSFNYRLGVFGSLHSEALQRPGDAATNSGNFALLDMIMALQWVQDNIAQFGGNAEAVTAMGHSAGGVSLWSLLRSPLAETLFSKAIILSAIPMGNSRSEVTARTDRLIRQIIRNDQGSDAGTTPSAEDLFGNPPRLREYLLGKSTAAILRASQHAGEDGRALGYQFDREDGYLLPAEQNDPRHDLRNAMPLLLGSTAHEANLLLYFSFTTLSQQTLWLLNTLSVTHPLLDAADLLSGEVLGFALNRLLGNLLIQRKLNQAGRDYLETGQALYRYEFAWENYPNPWRNVFGAFHGLDLICLFGNFDAPQFGHFALAEDTREEREALHRELVQAIGNFMKTAAPGDHAEEWPAWKPRGRPRVID